VEENNLIDPSDSEFLNSLAGKIENMSPQKDT